MIPSHWTENDILINDASHHFYRTGDGSKPALVLQHGFSDDGLCWLYPALDLEEQYDIIMPDARGHGRSARIQPDESVDMAADLAGIIQALGLQRPIVAGHSMGAAIAAGLAARFPEIPRAVILEDPPWFESEPFAIGNTSEEHPMSPWVDTITRLNLDELIAQTRTEHPTWPDWVINTWCPAKKRLDPNVLTTLINQSGTWQEFVPRFACPTLVLTADPERGGLVTPAAAAQIQELNPRVRIVHIKGVGHHIHFADYETFMKVLSSFLDEVESS